MFKEQMNKLKSFVFKEKSKEEEKSNKTDKRKIENLVVFLVILIITLITINIILGKNKDDTDEDDSGYKILASVKDDKEKEEEEKLEEKLEAILETIDGVRKCQSINYICKFKRSNAYV